MDTPGWIRPQWENLSEAAPMAIICGACAISTVSVAIALLKHYAHILVRYNFPGWRVGYTWLGIFRTAILPHRSYRRLPWIMEWVFTPLVLVRPMISANAA